ncbi:MAG: preprotein translocase subunit SecG [Ferruginibacter sp.]
MLVVFGILIILASVILGFIVLVQNPKGGGLSGTFGGAGTQIMGVKQTTDILEKGTWIFAGIVAVLCIISPIFIPKTTEKGAVEKITPTTPTAQPNNSRTSTSGQPAATPSANQQDTSK